MSGTVAAKKRLLPVGRRELRSASLAIGEHTDFFPAAARNGRGALPSLTIHLDGLDRCVTAELPDLAKPRPWIREFFSRHRLGPGDVVAIERLGRCEYRLYPFETQSDRSAAWRSIVASEAPGSGPTVLELFAGCGGMALGFQRAGFRTQLCVEWDAAACATIRANITDRVAQCAIQDIDRFPRADVVAGGPPCQGFSNLGDRVPFDPRNQLWRHFVRAVADAEPKAFVLENVPPLLKSQEYVELCGLMKELGYSVEGKILNAADYGVPQTRRRAIVIGVRGDLPSFPAPTHIDPRKRDLLSVGLLPWVTVREALAGLPMTPSEANWHIGRNPTPRSLERYRHVPPGGNRWDLPPRLTPDCWKRKTKGGTDLFGRLWWDRPAVTIRCEFYKPEKGRYLHPEADRPITHREAARLQGFGDDFDFQGKRIEVGIQIGNAVPPGLAHAIAAHLKLNLFSRQRRGGSHRSSRHS